MKKNYKLWGKLMVLSSAFILLFCSGCKIKKPVFTKINNLKINYVTKDSMNITLDAVYYNPSFFKANLRALNVKASVNDYPIYTVNEPIEIKMKRSDFFTVPITIAFNPSKSGQKAITVISSLVFDKRIKMNFQGTIEGKTFFKKFNVPFNFENSYDLQSIWNKNSEED